MVLAVACEALLMLDSGVRKTDRGTVTYIYIVIYIYIYICICIYLPTRCTSGLGDYTHTYAKFTCMYCTYIVSHRLQLHAALAENGQLVRFNIINLFPVIGHSVLPFFFFFFFPLLPTPTS